MIATLGDWTVRTSNEPATEEESTLGVRYHLTDVERWFSPAPFRTRVTEIPNGDGAFNPVRSYRGAKRMKVVGIVEAPDAEVAEFECWERIAALFPDGLPQTLTVESNGQSRHMRVWPDGQPDVVPFTSTKARFTVPVVAADPRKYGPVLDLPSVGVAGTAAAGLVWPMFGSGYLDFGTFSPSGVVTITNSGRAESWPIFEVRGAVGSAGFQIASGADVLEFTAAVALGTVLTLSPYAGGRATLAGTDVTTDLVRSDWPSIQPGETRNYVFIKLGTADDNARMTPVFSEAWW